MPGSNISNKMDIPTEWEQLKVSGLSGTLLVVGAPDVGKSTFARYLYGRLRASLACVAYLDGDPGQSSLGPPATMTLAMGSDEDKGFPPEGRVWRRFVGAVSPVGHMLPMVIGAARLIQAGREAGARAIVYDTTGLIDPARGGAHLKQAKIDLLRPVVVFAIQEGRELEYLLRPLRRSQQADVIAMHISLAAQRRDPPTRKAYRARQFAQYFGNAQPVTVSWSSISVFPEPVFTLNRLVAMEDAAGFTLGLGIVRQIMQESRKVILLTSMTSLEKVDALRLGDVELDPQTFLDQPVRRE
jgi:polynucleotide 5'-hydroxyl-kinase GRC3/NOL9